MQEMALHHHQLQHHHQHPDGSHYDPAHNHPLINSSPPILPHPMSVLTQLNPQVSRGSLPHGSPSPPGSKSATPSPSSSNQEEESDPHLKVLMWQRFSSLSVALVWGEIQLAILVFWAVTNKAVKSVPVKGGQSCVLFCFLYAVIMWLSIFKKKIYVKYLWNDWFWEKIRNLVWIFVIFLSFILLF